MARCASVSEAKALLARINLTAEPFAPNLPTAQLHWIISDKSGSITLESVSDGIFVYDNPVGVLTNNPPFPIQLFNLNNYMGLSVDNPENRFSERLELNAYSRGMGAIGLPGDLSSASRFVRVAFTKMNSLSDDDEKSSVSQFSTFLVRSISSAAAADWRTESTRYPSTPRAATPIRAFITIKPMIITV